MTAEDRLRDRLRSAASSMPVSSGLLTSVQARSAQLQRRRNALRGGVGTFALVAVALVGVMSLRSRSIDEYSAPMQDSGDAAEAAMSEDESRQGGPEQQETAQSGVASPDSEALEQETADESANWGSAPPASADPETAVFATTVSIVRPPPAAEDATMRYSFSGRHAVARAADGWYAYDGADWQSVGLPDDLEVVAVDLSGSGRVAVFGVVRPLECSRSQVVAVRTDETWRYVRVDDGTPPTVAWELLDARIRVTDTAIELERAERLWLDDQCADASSPLTPKAAELVAELELLGEIRRDSWPHAPLDGGFAERWPHMARSDAHAAAASGADLDWTAVIPSRLTVPAVKLNTGRTADGGAVTVALHETIVLDVATTVHVSGGMAMLQRGEQTWEVCPIPDEELHQVNGEIGQAGEHLAVVVGKPEQTLFVVERAG
ncbi:hypothetical protein [Candidatus Poriferisodalis sp.]|uniref:hypothetical protein n=1 Tax=Candidatus Poriferisodalis sp. TaxID=3101277 RepID=UPI003B0236AF